MEPTTKKWKNRKLKNWYAEKYHGKQFGESVESVLKKEKESHSGKDL